MTRIHIIFQLTALLIALVSLRSEPSVSSVRAQQRVGTNVVDIFYDLGGTDGPVQVDVELSDNGGLSYGVVISSLEGDFGANVVPGSNHHIVWDAGTDLPDYFNTGMRIRIKAMDTGGPVPDDFVLIPRGNFTMGSPEDEPSRGLDEDLHVVTLTRDFYLLETEVTKAQWDAVLAEAVSYNYTDLPEGRSGYNGNDTHPVTEVSWYDAVKWLNLRSEVEGLTPCYTRSDSGAVYRTGVQNGISRIECDFNANGYRLPTESEWEYACRAGTTTAYHNGELLEPYCDPLDQNLDAIAWYCGNSDENTHSVGQKQPNAWGLSDMLGNVYEWCWDGSGHYPMESAIDPTGVDSSTRIFRGGVFDFYANNCRCARRASMERDVRNYRLGFRAARTNRSTGVASIYRNFIDRH